MQMQTQAAVAAMAVGAHALPLFDLRQVLLRVSREHPDWDASRVRAASDDYRFFMATAKAEPLKKHRPSKDVDEVWHAHILYTKQYMAECVAYFGHYFHHEPDPIGAKQKCDGAVKSADCQGGGDGCTACGSGCSGGGTIRAKGPCMTEGPVDQDSQDGPVIVKMAKADCGGQCCGGGNSCGGCCESGGGCSIHIEQ